MIEQRRIRPHRQMSTEVAVTKVLTFDMQHEYTELTVGRANDYFIKDHTQTCKMLRLSFEWGLKYY